MWNVCGIIYSSAPCRKFIAENLPPIQFKNPNVQMVTFKNATPTPFVNIYFGELWNIDVIYNIYPTCLCGRGSVLTPCVL